MGQRAGKAAEETAVFQTGSGLTGQDVRSVTSVKVARPSQSKLWDGHKAPGNYRTLLLATLGQDSNRSLPVPPVKGALTRPNNSGACGFNDPGRGRSNY